MVTPQIDTHPTHTFEGFKLRAGRPLPFGATRVPGGINFSVYSRNATSCKLVLFRKHESEPFIEIPFMDTFGVGNVFAMVVFDLDYENIEYGYKMDGPNDRQEGHWFDPTKVLLDPYGKVVGGRDVWGEQPDWNDQYQHRARIVFDDYDWEADKPLDIPFQDLVIYEAHVRSFTQHPSSGSRNRGTFAGIREKIPYLKELGINCLELMPVFEFDEFENSRIQPDTQELLVNYWGYSTVNFFAPKAGFAATGEYSMQVDEFKALIKELHANGIEVFLDVVFNHTAEGNENGPYISFRGIDNQTYYMLTPEGYYFNFSGTGNTLNCNNPIVRHMVLDCLRYWASEYHIDGFRFDLAAILGRDQSGAPLSNPPLLESLAYDPILAKCKLIAEAWDAGGLYQVGSFPAYGRWAEWNGKYRDTIRKFLKGEPGQVEDMAQRLQGSPDLYSWRGPTASINFITAHDGFTLNDLVSYDEKHNEANGEGNNDGANDNDSWNSGSEGPTDDPEINALRQRQMKNAFAMLIVSQGVPMLLMGDEVARTQDGNNNAYCHDTELVWMDWSLLETNAGLYRFFKNCIATRRAHAVLRQGEFPGGRATEGGGYPISFHGTQAWNPDWSFGSRVLAFMLIGGDGTTEHVYVAMNMHWDAQQFELPELPGGDRWHVVANTGAPEPEDIWEPGTEPVMGDQNSMFLGPRSVAILVGK